MSSPPTPRRSQRRADSTSTTPSTVLDHWHPGTPTTRGQKRRLESSPPSAVDTSGTVGEGAIAEGERETRASQKRRLENPEPVAVPRKETSAETTSGEDAAQQTLPSDNQPPRPTPAKPTLGTADMAILERLQTGTTTFGPTRLAKLQGEADLNDGSKLCERAKALIAAYDAGLAVYNSRQEPIAAVPDPNEPTRVPEGERCRLAREERKGPKAVKLIDNPILPDAAAFEELVADVAAAKVRLGEPFRRMLRGDAARQDKSGACLKAKRLLEALEVGRATDDKWSGRQDEGEKRNAQREGFTAEAAQGSKNDKGDTPTLPLSTGSGEGDGQGRRPGLAPPEPRQATISGLVSYRTAGVAQSHSTTKAAQTDGSDSDDDFEVIDYYPSAKTPIPAPQAGGRRSSVIDIETDDEDIAVDEKHDPDYEYESGARTEEGRELELAVAASQGTPRRGAHSRPAERESAVGNAPQAEPPAHLPLPGSLDDGLEEGLLAAMVASQQATAPKRGSDLSTPAHSPKKAVQPNVASQQGRPKPIKSFTPDPTFLGAAIDAPDRPSCVREPSYSLARLTLIGADAAAAALEARERRMRRMDVERLRSRWSSDVRGGG